LYPVGRNWPDAQPFRIELYEDAVNPMARPVFDDAARVLRIPLPKGERATLRLSMRLSKRDVYERMGLWQWLDAATQQQIEASTLDGRCWLFTPWQDVELIHAVQRPLIQPHLDRLTIDRFLSATHALPRFIATCSLKSTDRLDLLAQWHEPDDMQPTGPVDHQRHDVAFEVKVTDSRDYTAGDDAYPEHTLPAEEQEGPDVVGINSRKRDRVAVKRHEFNDTRYRRIEYRLKGTTRYREYLTPSLLLMPDPVLDPGPYEQVEKSLFVEGPPAVTWIPNSAPPPAPQILYIVPTFGWVRSQDETGTARSWRRGGGLRVYLDRPWNLTGYGEMLAVVLPAAGFSGDPDTQPAENPYKNRVTQWGNDPIWESPFVAGIAPAPARFPLARFHPDAAGAWLPAGAPASEADQSPGPFRTSDLRTPSGSAQAPVGIAPHDVFYDSQRQLWYCDIEIDHGRSYWPFVRLALARYQPCSTEGAHLSEVVLADFMQLTADRSLTVRSEREGRIRHVTVYGHGDTQSAGAREVRPRSEIHPLTGEVTEVPPVSPTSLVDVWLERLEPSLGEDFGWQRIADGKPAPLPPGHGVGIFAALPRLTPQIHPEQAIRANRLLTAGAFDRLQAEGLVESLLQRPPLWDGRVELPPDDAPRGQLRLVIAEYEEYPIDADGDSHGTTRTGTGRRLVFLEQVAVS
ncbi:MAG: hypothetical protein RIS76_3072, partial [Verrucomicrobiota bacterium]